MNARKPSLKKAHPWDLRVRCDLSRIDVVKPFFTPL